VREQLDQAVAAASPYANDALAGLLANPQSVTIVNAAGAGALTVLLLVGLVLQWTKAKNPAAANRWWAPKA
jgi:microcystin degradation protein MlrC